MVFLGFLLVIVGAFIIYWNIPYSPQKSKFDQDMRKRAEKVNDSGERYTREEIEKLPEPLQRYCNYIGMEGFEGGMKGTIGKMIQLFDVHTKQGYQAGIITLFAEALTLNPGILFSEYVTYEIVDANTVNVVIECDGITGRGTIYLNEEGAITSFYSGERQVENIDGAEVAIGWRCEYEDYREQNGILQAKIVRSVKEYPDKEVVYFSSDHYEIEYVK